MNWREINKPLLVVSLLAVVAAGEAWRHRTIRQPAGILVREVPVQSLHKEDMKLIRFGKQDLRPLASYKIRGRVLSFERYRFDYGATLSPIDVCIGWGPLSDTAVIDQLEIKQQARYCSYRWKGEPPVDPEIIKNHLANMHLIPSQDWVEDALFILRPGQIVELSGDLVEVIDDHGNSWTSSLTREDTGKGACEVMYVKSVKL